MKKIACIMCCMLALLMFSAWLPFTAGAAVGDYDSPEFFENGLPRSEKAEILRGTPTVDGKLDSIYLESFCIYLAPGTEGYPDNEHTMENTRYTEGSAFFLYDDNYLYVCTVVRDKTLMSMGKEWCDTQRWPWDNDGAEVFVYLGDRVERSVHVDAFGHGAKEHYKKSSVRDVYEIKPESEWGAYIIGDDLYSVEIAFPLKNGEKAGDTIGAQLEIDDRWDLETPGEVRGIFLSHSPSQNLIRLSNDSVVETLPTDPTTDIPATEPEKTNNSNDISVPLVIAAGVFVVIAVIVTCIASKRKNK